VHPEVNKKYEIPTPISILEIILEDVIKIWSWSIKNVKFCKVFVFRFKSDLFFLCRVRFEFVLFVV
jgi:hypothetical protein